jgi:dTDP-4-amino-4,6-dideoxygalactose transaminase
MQKPRNKPYLVFGSPLIGDDEIAAVVEALRSGWLGTGPRVNAFERDFAEYVDSAYAVAVNSCTAGLHLAMLAACVKPGDEVIVPSLTFVATANAVVHAGGVPVIADVDPNTMCITPEEIARCITPRTRAVVPVHFAGRPCRIREIVALADDHGLAVVEDCAHAIETLVEGRHVGLFGALGAFSFYVTKNVVTGEGGMITVTDEEVASRLKRLALHGLSEDAWARFSDKGFKHYSVVEPGFKYNMTDIQAAIGIPQLARVEENLVRRNAIWAHYDESFADLPLEVPAPEEPGTRHARHLYTVMLDLGRIGRSRDDVQADLHERGIGTGVHYRALHLHQYYRRRSGLRLGDLPGAEWVSERTLSLPLSAKLTDDDVDDVVMAVRAVVDRAGRRPMRVRDEVPHR